MTPEEFIEIIDKVNDWEDVSRFNGGSRSRTLHRDFGDFEVFFRYASAARGPTTGIGSRIVAPAMEYGLFIDSRYYSVRRIPMDRNRGMYKWFSEAPTASQSLRVRLAV